MTSGFVYKKSTVFVRGSIIIFLIIFLCLWKNAQRTKMQMKERSRRKQVKEGENARVDEEDQDEWMEM